MRNHRCFVDRPLRVGESVDLPAGAARHLLGTLRLRPGDACVLFNGDGHDYQAELASAARTRPVARVVERGPAEPPLVLDVHLGIGISRGERMDLVLQKATELGAAGFVPLVTERCVVKLDASRADRRHQHWLGVIAGACEQCGRRRLPALAPIMPLADYLGRTEGGLVLSPAAGSGLATLEPTVGACHLLSGPEGGLSDAELRSAVAHGFVPLRLGPRTLRTETAPIAALAALQALWGDFR